MSKDSGGEVTYEIVADDSQLESDLNEAGKKVEKSAKKTAKKSEDAEKESAEVKKSVKEDVTKKNEQENDKQEKDDDDSYQNREESAKSHGSKLSSIASGTAKAIGAGMLAAGTAIAGVSVAAVKSANDIDQAMNQYIASTGKVPRKRNGTRRSWRISTPIITGIPSKTSGRQWHQSLRISVILMTRHCRK